MNAVGASPTTASTVIATSSPKIEFTYDNGSFSSISYNDSMEMDLNEILWNLYNKFDGDTNYLLIILYVPVIAIAVTANILVIAVVFKYHYMRRYVRYKRSVESI